MLSIFEKLLVHDELSAFDELLLREYKFCHAPMINSLAILLFFDQRRLVLVDDVIFVRVKSLEIYLRELLLGEVHLSSQSSSCACLSLSCPLAVFWVMS